MADKADVKASTVVKGRKSIAYLQKCKDEGRKIVQMCPMVRDHFQVMAAEMAGVDVCRSTIPMAGDESIPVQMGQHEYWIHVIRSVAKTIHLNWFMVTPQYSTAENAINWGARLTFVGADSLLPMGITNDVLKAMSDNWIVTFGHIGALSGWQTNAQGGYKRCGKTAEDAMRIFKMGYEYQENGMKAMSVELTPIEVSNAIAKKLRVPVIGIAAGGACDGSEMVDFDLFDIMPSAASHAKAYANFWDWATTAYMDWADDVRDGVYPEDKHGYHMDPEELAKFEDAIAKF